MLFAYIAQFMSKLKPHKKALIDKIIYYLSFL